MATLLKVLNNLPIPNRRGVLHFASELRQALMDAFSLLDELSISPATVDLVEAIDSAQRTRLSLYDVSYLWLACTFDVELVTRDKLARADEALRGGP
jgi:predicted nucleic acid-binding protein